MGERYSNTVLVDMDGVIADLDNTVVARMPREIARVARLNYFIEDDYPEHARHVLEIMNHPEFFHTLPVFEGAIEGWQRLLDLGFDPRICSAPLPSNEYCVEGKQAYLEEHLVPKFGSQVIDRAIFDRNKYDHDGIALVDDQPHLKTGDGRATWQHVVFDRTYNQDSSATLRLHGWADPNLEQILTIAQSRYGQ